MSSVTRSTLSSSYPSYKQKFEESDFDLRQQALYDLANDIRAVSVVPTKGKTPPDPTYADEHIEKQFTNDVLGLVLNDPNSAVKNEAVKCLEVMASKSRAPSIATIIRGLMDGITSDKEETRDIACPALKRIVRAVPEHTPQLGHSIDMVLNRSFPVLTSTSPPPNPQIASELLQILKDIYVRFPTIISGSSSALTSSKQSLVSIFSTSRNSAIRKRAIEAITALIAACPVVFDTKLQGQLQNGLKEGGDVGNAWINLVASLAKEQAVVATMKVLVGSGKIVDVIMEHTNDTEEIEAVEAALTTVESLITKCPSEITPYISAILSRSLELVKHDPNYVELDDDDDDVDMNDDDEDDDDDFEEEVYSDDEDLSWKIRRAAAKVLFALIANRKERLIDFYKSAVPVLLSRFTEREDGVRLEVLAAMGEVLRQTAHARASEALLGGRYKRKRSEEMDEDTSDETTARYLGQSHTALVNAILKQVNSKNEPTRQQAFVLLRLTDEALEGGLDGEASAICTAAASAIESVGSGSSASLPVAALAFLTVFFRDHSARVYASHLESLVPAMTRCMKNNLQPITFEAFAAASSLAQSLRPRASASPLAADFSRPIQQLAKTTIEVLGDSTVDGDVRERAVDTLGYLLVHEGDALFDAYPTCLPLITARLATETTAHTAVQVIDRVAASPLCQGAVFNSWLLDVLPSVVVSLRKMRRGSSKNAEFACLQSLLNRIGAALPLDTAEGIIAELVSFADAPQAISTISLVLSLQPQARSTVSSQFLPRAMELVKASSIHPQLVDALAAFFGAYAASTAQHPKELVEQLRQNLGQEAHLPDATRGGTAMYAATARCIGSIIASSPASALDVLGPFLGDLSSGKGSEPDIYFALLCIGEIGRTADLSKQPGLFDQILQYFDASSEEVRSAVAFALGNLAVGSPGVFLPAVLQQVAGCKTEADQLLSLHALKEVILHSSAAQLEKVADSLWEPLFDDREVASKKAKKAPAGGEDVGDDGIRNVKAACIGKLTTTVPGKYLAQLQMKLRGPPRDRALVAAAVRYTFIETSASYDELIAPLIYDFLALMEDENLIVRRLSSASLNAAIQNKPHLIVDRLSSLQPLLFRETLVKPELQREVKMGPFKITEDDGLENRKTAYETMYTLLGTLATKLDVPAFTDRVVAALDDVNEIKVLGFMLLHRVYQLAPSYIAPRLDETVESLKMIMKDVEIKEDTVKQDLERKVEMQKSAMRTAIPIYRHSSSTDAPAFHSFVAGLLVKKEWQDPIYDL